MNSDNSIICIIITILTLYLYCQHRNYINRIKAISIKPKKSTPGKFFLLQNNNHYHTPKNNLIPSFSIGNHTSSHSNAIVATAFKSKK